MIRLINIHANVLTLQFVFGTECMELFEVCLKEKEKFLFKLLVNKVRGYYIYRRKGEYPN